VPSRSAGIFISYRREEAGYAAGWLGDLLAGQFPNARIFLDVEAIDAGADFAESIYGAVTSCDNAMWPKWIMLLNWVSARGW
jgi:hypothetical protein